jgi:hypothetical protein
MGVKSFDYLCYREGLETKKMQKTGKKLKDCMGDSGTEAPKKV